MTILQISSIKDFMNRLLRTELFDHFLLSEASIKGKCSFIIDGHILPDFYTPEEREELALTGLECLPFSMLRENCFSLIKGKNTPSFFKFVFRLSPVHVRQTLKAGNSSLTESDLSGVFINIKFQDGILTCTSGISYRTFTLDRTFEQEWDALLCRFFNAHDIAYTTLP